MDGKYFGKCKPSELRAELEQARRKSKPQPRVKAVLKKVLANVILNRSECAVLMTDIVELMAINDYEIRRLCSHYVAQFAELNPADAAAALPFYQRFGADLDPLLRALALKTVSAVPLPGFEQLTFALAAPLLGDANAHVRSAAAFAVARLHQAHPAKTVKLGLLEALNGLLYDDNQIVVANALAALGAATEASPSLSLTVDKNHSSALLREIGTANEWRQVYLLNSVMAYVPQRAADAVDVMVAVLPCLSSENTAVVLNALKVVLYLSNYVPEPEAQLPQLPQKLGAVLVSLLWKPAELQFLVLRNLILLLLNKRYLVDVDVTSFFWKLNDPIYIKDTKLEIIYLLATEQNIDVVARELEEYATEVDVKMARKAVRAFGNLSVKLTGSASKCVSILYELLQNDIPYILQESAVALRNILRKYPGTYDYILRHIMRHYEVMEETDSKVAIIWMVGQFCEKIPEAETIIDHFIKSFDEDPLAVQYTLLTAVVKYYVNFPVQGERLVMEILKNATEEQDNPDLRERGFFYWRLISHPDNGGDDFQRRTKEFIIDPNPAIGSEHDNIDPDILEELELNVGTLASIYLKSVKHVFRLAKRKSLAPSPALQPRRKNAPPPERESPDRDLQEPVSREPERVPSYDRDLYQKPLPAVNRNRSNSSFFTNGSQTSSDSPKKSLAQKLGRKASIIGRKMSKS